MVMARLGAGQGEESCSPCNEHGWCLCAGARIVVPVGGCGRELGRCFSCSPKPAGLPRSFLHQGWGVQLNVTPACCWPWEVAPWVLLLHFDGSDGHDMVNFQDQAVGVSSKCFHSGAVCQFVLS